MVLVIAEAGVNHNGSRDLAHKLIETAKETGADAVKFQFFVADKLEPRGPRRGMLEKLQFDKSGDCWFSLKKHCDEIGVEFMCTPFGTWELWWLASNRLIKRIKLGSGSVQNMALLRDAGTYDLPVILSTGMSTFGDIARAIEHIGRPRDVTLLHCTSAYPTPLDAVNLRAIMRMREQFSQPIGFSDHSLSVSVPAVAVGLGATVIEKHLTLDRHLEGPDHKASLEPDEFKLMVKYVREAEQALGTGEKQLQTCELPAFRMVEERLAYHG